MSRIQVLNYILFTVLVISSIQAYWVPNDPNQHQNKRFYSLIAPPKVPTGARHSYNNYDKGFAALQAVFNRMNLKLAEDSSKLGARYPVMKRSSLSDLGYPMMKKSVFSEGSLPEGLPIYDF